MLPEATGSRLSTDGPGFLPGDKTYGFERWSCGNTNQGARNQLSLNPLS